MVITYGILSSINVLVAHQHGANNEEGIAWIVRDGIWLALLLVIPTFILLWNISPIFLLLGQNQSVVLLATSYLHAWAWGLLPQFIMAALIELMIGLGQMRVIYPTRINFRNYLAAYSAAYVPCFMHGIQRC